MANILRKMFTLAAVLLLSGLLFSASAQKVNLNFREARLENVLQSIKRQTNLSLVYSDHTIDVNRKVSINVSDVDVKDALSMLLEGSGAEFEIRDSKIYLIEKKQVAAGDGGGSLSSSRERSRTQKVNR